MDVEPLVIFTQRFFILDYTARHRRSITLGNALHPGRCVLCWMGKEPLLIDRPQSRPLPHYHPLS